MKSKITKIISISIAAVLFLFCTFPCIASASTPINKEEVVYVGLNSDGSVKGVYVVNILKGGGEFVDYGNYSAIRNMTTSDNLSLDNGTITGQTNANKLYYEGVLDDAEIPWNVSVRYFLDGKEYSAVEVAGKSGNLELQISIKQNPYCNAIFFDNYALQVTVTLDTKLCKNIESENATVANVGSNKQLTYTILPGNESEINITSEVTDFRMDAISLNGVRLNLNIDFETEELLTQVSDLTDGIIKVDDGAKELQDGTAELKTAVEDDLMSGISSLHDGAITLDDGIESLQKGINEVQNGLNQLNEKSEDLTSGSAEMKNALMEINIALSSVSVSANELSKLTQASSEIKSGIDELHSGVKILQSNIGYTQYKAAMSANGLNIDELLASNTKAISNLSTQIVSLEQAIVLLPDGEEKARLQTQISEYSAIVTLLDGNNAAIGVTEVYLKQLSSAVDSLYDGTSKLKENYAEFDNAIGSLADTLAGLLVNVNSLNSAINQVSTEYAKLDSGINEYTSGVTALAVGYTNIVDGVRGLADGSKELSSGISTLDNGTNDLYEGIITLYDGTLELSDGTGEIREQTGGIDTEIADKVDGILNSISSDKSEIVSFVSEKNTDIGFVQFVIQTEAIEQNEATEVVAVEEETLNFWQKLLRLFGF